MASTRPIEIAEKASDSNDLLTQSVRISSSPNFGGEIFDDYLQNPRESTLVRTNSRPNARLGLPHKWRPLSDYEVCNKQDFEKYGLNMPAATYNTFKLYIKKKDKDKANPDIYFIKENKPGSFLPEFEALNAAIHNFMHDGIIPSAHVIYDDSIQGKNLPVAICTRFDTSFIPVKDNPVTKNDLNNPEIVKSLAIIIGLAQLLEECDLHGNNFVWADTSQENNAIWTEIQKQVQTQKQNKVTPPIPDGTLWQKALNSGKICQKRVDVGQAMWNYLVKNPKTAPELRVLITSIFGGAYAYLFGPAPADIFPLTTDEMESSPNFKSATPRYCPGTSGDKSLFSNNSNYRTWFSTNAFSTDELKVYRDPENLQKNPDYNFIKYKLNTKFTFLTKELIAEIAKLYLRTEENGVSLNHIDEYASHLAERVEQCKNALLESKQFETFVKSHLATAMNEIFDETDVFKEKINQKVSDENKPYKKRAYGGLFDRANVDLADAVIKAKRVDLDLKATTKRAASIK